MKTILHYIKITLALVLLLQMGEVKAQSFVSWNTAAAGSTLSGTFTGGTATVTQSATGAALFLVCPGQTTLAPGTTQTGNTIFQRSPTGAYSAVPKDIIVTFSTPVIITKLNVGGLDAPVPYIDQVEFSGVSFSGYTASSKATATSTGVQPTDGYVQQYGNFTNSVSAVTSFTIKSVPRAGLYAAVFVVEMEVMACKAGTTAPTLSATTLTAACPANTINLSPLVTSTLPTGTTVQWFTNNTHSGSPISNPAAVTVSGVSTTYYAFYYDSVANCYSPASAAVTATACPLTVVTTCPAASVDLSSRVTSAPPTGYTYTYHSGTPATDANKLPSSVVNTSGTYYAATYFAGQNCYAATSRPMVVTITNCCATLAAPSFN